MWLHTFRNHFSNVDIYTITNWLVSLSKICHSWPNNVVTHSCASISNIWIKSLTNNIQHCLKADNKLTWQGKVQCLNNVNMLINVYLPSEDTIVNNNKNR